ncbi:uncharacterized protein LOC126907073 [Daktulosphaira vitifoliae]|uniref:uncharacterized protein LOC126907073 n=1 Tax=Daktulosphaira vitifoliae TaxID=58002 RepID=UPI0021AA9C3D|nr:uncharacterized protein LOC126907073 [Daktulosphaira vitifoliae]
MSTDYEKLVKDHLRMRLIESGWSENLNEIIKNSVKERLAGGQFINAIKFEQLYQDVALKARDLISPNMELEIHTKLNEYLSLNLENEEDEDDDNLFSSDEDTRSMDVDK